MSPPLFTVVIPTFGRADLLGEAVASVLAQSVDSFECLVIDDCNARGIVVPDDDRIAVVRRDVNGGSAAARNTGLSAAKGEFVTFLDDDDLLAPDRLELALAGHQRADVAVCWAQYVGGAPRDGRVLEGDVRDVLFTGLVPNMGQTSVRREVALRFDDRLRCCEDIEWWVRTSQQHEVATTRHHGLEYRRHEGARHLKSAHDRAEARTMILGWHEDFFAERPRSRAFQWKRIGMYLSDAGERRPARRAFARSFRASPSVRTLRHLVAPRARRRAPWRRA